MSALQELPDFIALPPSPFNGDGIVGSGLTRAQHELIRKLDTLPPLRDQAAERALWIEQVRACVCVCWFVLSFCCWCLIYLAASLVLSSLPDYLLICICARWLNVNRSSEQREQQVLPGLMAEAGVEFWALPMKEYDEDIVWRSIAPANQVNARRRTVIIYR